MLYPVIKCECDNKKVANPRDKPLEQILQQKWRLIVEEEDIGDLFLMTNIDGINKI
jgi:hypothetical protein